jgi:putative ABC transport system permease protein
MRALDRSLFRELSRLRAQVATLSLVVAAGATVFVAMKVTVDALEGAREQYFRAQRFADLFVSLKRAPRSVAADLAAISGVAQVDVRIAGEVPMFVPGRTQAASVRLMSIDPRAIAPLNSVRIREARGLDPDRDDEIILNEPFAQANHLKPGDTVSAVLNGRLRKLRVVGIGISPEFVFSLPPGAIAPSDERYGVGWMSRAPLESAFEMRGAFNDAVFRLAPGANRGEVIEAVDRRLHSFGGRGAYGRDEQQSAKQLDARLGRIRGMLVFLPLLFLGVAAFVLNVVLGRLVQGQREQIGALKAFGYGNARLGRHYLQLAILTVVPGAILGVAGGLELGHLLIGRFVLFFRLPLADEGANWAAIFGAVTVVFIAAAVGALGSVRSVTALRPVEAMRAPAPPSFRRSFIERLRIVRRVPAGLLMILRNLRLAPARAVASIAALMFATALCVTGSFFDGSINALVAHQFGSAMREDLSVAFARPIARGVCDSLGAMTGVVACEPLVVTPMRARFGAQSKQIGVTALAENGALRRVIDRTGSPVPVPPSGLLVSSRLLGKLGAAVGDRITLETIEGRPRAIAVPVAAALDDEVGLNVYVTPSTLAQLTGEMPLATSALLRMAPGSDAKLYARLAEMPTVIGVSSRVAAVIDFETATAESMRVMNFILALLSAALAIAVVYNGARVALSERARDLASLRVLGFTRAEVARILLGEMAIVVAVGVPLGLLLGRWLAGLTVAGMAADEFRLPLVITLGTYVRSAIVVLGSALVSALQMRRLINRLDLIEVLKTRE